MAMVKPIVLTACSVALLFSLGCDEKKKVALDPELQKQLEEFEKKMDEQDQAFLTRRSAKTLDVSLDEGQPPAADSDRFNIGAPSKTAANGAAEAAASNQGSSLTGGENEDEWDQLDSPSRVVGYNSQDGISRLENQNAVAAKQPSKQITTNSPPNDVCQQFLKLLEDGNHQMATKFLTNVAQLETARANLMLEAPGGPGCHIEMRPARYATTERKVAEVECLLHQEGASAPVSLTWMMRHQYNGWKISGMSIRMDQNSSPDLLSFENPVDLARIQQTVEADPTIEFHPSEDLLQAPEMTANGKTESNVKR